MTETCESQNSVTGDEILDFLDTWKTYHYVFLPPPPITGAEGDGLIPLLSFMGLSSLSSPLVARLLGKPMLSFIEAPGTLDSGVLNARVLCIWASKLGVLNSNCRSTPFNCPLLLEVGINVVFFSVSPVHVLFKGVVSVATCELRWADSALNVDWSFGSAVFPTNVSIAGESVMNQNLSLSIRTKEQMISLIKIEHYE